MIRKFTYGVPFETDAVVVKQQACNDLFPFFTVAQEDGLSFSYTMEKNDIVYGLGENMRGINKRGFSYVSNCIDDAIHSEDKNSLYAAHNFIIVHGKETFGMFIDCPEKMTYDVGFQVYDSLVITTPAKDMDIYMLEFSSLKEIVHAFRLLIGESYIPPKWGFGYQQSRWGYQCEEDFYQVADEYAKNDIPLESIYMDIDYMDHYKDFTVDSATFPHFEKLVDDMKERGIKLVPIIDAGVKIEKGYDIYEEGIAENHFCTDKDGKPFVAAVWPGRVHFPDVINPKSRKWFGLKYNTLIEKGIEGFWNDMNEPAIFYSEESLKECLDYIDSVRGSNMGLEETFGMQMAMGNMANNPKDYERFYHNVNGEKIVHSKLHNLYGYYMTRAAAEGFAEIDSQKRFLLFSRSSYIGMHRYGGIWTGDNCAWWQHLLLNIKMMPSLNMCGFLYTGADLGGFGCDTSYDLLVRWMQFGIFTPLMRNHATRGTREQELYQFKDVSYFSELIKFRYALIPYLYSEYVKAAKESSMLFSSLGFEYETDSLAAATEDQILLGGSTMIAPIYTQNAIGRYVYLPESMLLVTFSRGSKRSYTVLSKGHHFISLALDEFPIFIRKNQLLPLCKPSSTTETLDTTSLELIGFSDDSDSLSYQLYDDDGYNKSISLEDNISTITVKKDGDSWNPVSNNPHLSFFDVTVITASTSSF